MGRRKDNGFWESALFNTSEYNIYIKRLSEMAISMFEWINLPETIDERFLELTLFGEGKIVFFKDDDIGYLTLQMADDGQLDVYRIPTRRRAISCTNYTKQLDNTDSVIIYNNVMHTASYYEMLPFARRLTNLDRIIDVNVNAQKTPTAILATEKQRLAMLNLYKQYDGNEPFIFGDKNLDLNNITCITTGAPYIGKDLYELKTQIWNEALTTLGIVNVSIQKRERMVVDEAIQTQGSVVASRYSRLNARKQACKQINSMFGLNIDCKFRETEPYYKREELFDDNDDNNEVIGDE